MSTAFDDASVSSDEMAPLIEGLRLPDPDDRHVLAAAIARGAQSIVTFNLADFPPAQLSAHHVEAIHPDVFPLDQLDLAPSTILTALAEQAARLRRPPMDLSGLLTRLAHCDVPRFADEVRRLAL